MPHVELSLTDVPPAPRSRAPADPVTSSLDQWAAAVAAAAEPCLILDAQATIVAASPSCAELMGLGEARAVRGQRWREAVYPLVDFTATPAELDETEVHMLPPLLAISSGRMARGLMRMTAPDGTASTLDAIATPLRDGAGVAGSLTFFARV